MDRTCSGAEVIFFPHRDLPGVPFAEAVRVGDILYLSGVIGIDSQGNVTGGIEEQAAHIMEHIQTILARHGLNFDHAVKFTIMLADMSDWAAFNRIYTPFFKPGRLPARSAFAASGLALNARAEVEVMAYFPG